MTKVNKTFTGKVLPFLFSIFGLFGLFGIINSNDCNNRSNLNSQKFFCTLFLLIFTSFISLNKVSAEEIVESKVYVVKRGDTLYKLSKNFGVSVNEILDQNNLSHTNILIGQRLIISKRVERNTFRNTSTEWLRPSNSQNTQNNSQQVLRHSNQNYSNSNSAMAFYGFQMARNDFQVYKQSHSNQNGEFNWFTITHKGRVLASFRDHVESKYSFRKDGILYSGGQKITYDYIKNLNYDENISYALAFVSSNEGGASDLNFYDGAGSFGFIQFTIKYGSFAKYVALLKEQDYPTYYNYLEKYGIVHEQYINEKGLLMDKVVVYAPEGYKGRTKLEGNMVINYIIDNKKLYGALIMLGQATKATQVESAYQQYYLPAQNLELQLEGMRRSINIDKIFKTKFGKTAITDLSVKLGVHGAKMELEKVLNKMIRNVNYSNIKYISDYAIIKAIIKYSSNPLVKKRMTKLLNGSAQQS
ncbi:MAG: LysM peptidoglycan-binding domain-containing protein [Flammeovirgaceae bacterium]|nr:LysM peptidoglycan-binding domain-containing protein [Flammeovirgaceae bacterium]